MTLFDISAPGTGRVVGRVVDMTRTEVSETVENLRAAAGEWASTPVRQRVQWLYRFRDWLLDHEDELAEVLQDETGKPWAEANLEIPYIVEAINYYGRLAPQQLRSRTVRRHGLLALGKGHTLHWHPYPVVGIITPWNFPLGLSLLDAVPALLSGATVVIKPSEHTPLTVNAVARGWTAIGAPPVLAVCTGGSTAGGAVVDSVDFIQFTGSSATGRAVAKRAAERLIPYGLELGGKDALIVRADADLQRAANAAVWGAMANAGQMCTSIERVYVHEDVYDRFIALVTAEVGDLRIGHDDKGYRFDIGPLITAAQLEVVRTHVDDALSKGARIAGGEQSVPRPSSPNLYPPVVLVDVDHSMSCMREETFGPVLPVMRISTDAEAIALVNNSRYGLSATIFTADVTLARRMAHRLDVGAVNINDVFANLYTLALPQGGRRESGIGTRNGSGALFKYCRPQAVVTARIHPRREPTWFPYTPLRGALVHRAARLLGARDLVRRLYR
ncbi:aldehyde dehydrogenase family protein [Mycolicibacterium cosmeticum]|uniref:aldehyde dehydrogenase family protein n=1 Tax=Mycolicibacterium cosmeticum TaxID=258533 RepID=UPI003204E99F